MKLSTFRHYAGEATSSLIKNRLMSVASILTVASCIFIVSVFYCVASNIDSFLIQLESSIEIIVFITDELEPDAVKPLYNKIADIPHVAEVTYKSQKESFEEFSQTLDDPRILSGLEQDNPFLRSFKVTIDDLRYQADVVQTLNDMKNEGIDFVRYNQSVADIALVISNVVRVICMVLILVLAAISIVIIINTIRITVNARKTEINIMKYVGATDWFIRWPFIIEGVLIGIIGSLIPVIICWLGYNGVITMIKEGLPLISFVQFREGYEIFTYLFPFALFLGMLIGVIGSAASIRRHLKV